MSEKQYTPPKVWKNEASSGNKWANINSPESGARFERELPKGGHPFQLYSLGRVDLCCTYFGQQYIGSHINTNASDTMLA